MRLKDKVALVTGARRGIGRGIAEVFAEEGAHVAVNDIANDEQAEAVAGWIRSKGRRATTVRADVANRTEVEAMVDKVWKELGPIDILSTMPGSRRSCPFSTSPTISGRGSPIPTCGATGSARRSSADASSPRAARAAS